MHKVIKEPQHVTKYFNIEDIYNAIQSINSSRSKNGAETNSLEHEYNSNTNTSLNLVGSRSRIEDLDIPKAVSEKEKDRLLENYRMGMMRKRMQDDASVLKLFGGV